MIGQPRTTDSRRMGSGTAARVAGRVCGLSLVLLLAASTVLRSAPVEASPAAAPAAEKRGAGSRWQARVRCPSFERRARVRRSVTGEVERYRATCRSAGRELGHEIRFNRRTCTTTYGIELSSDGPIADATEATVRLERRVRGRWVAVETAGSAGGVSGMSPDRRWVGASTRREVDDCRGLRAIARRNPLRVRGRVLRETIWATVLDSARPRKRSAARTAAEDTRQPYIVEVQGDPEEVARRHAAAPKHVYSRVYRGFSADLNERQAARLSADASVTSLVRDTGTRLERQVARPSRVLAQVVPDHVRRVGADTAPPSLTVGVAVIDSGIARVPDLRRNLARRGSVSFVAAEPSPFSDDFGHGTHVAGIIGAADNSVGTVGVNANAELFSCKAYDAGGFAQWSALLACLEHLAANAAEFDIRVVNMSFAGPGDYAPFREAVAAAERAGLTLVASAGNSSADAGGWNPAGYDESVITVSALADSDGAGGGLGPAISGAPDDSFAPFSNFGRVVDCGAPGVGVLSTLMDGSYGLRSGTSQSAPVVAGLASRLLAVNPGLSPDDVRQRLVSGGEPLGDGHTDPSGVHPEPVCVAR